MNALSNQPDLLRLFRALEFAAARHLGQSRKGARSEPYLHHPIRVARILVEHGDVHDPDILVAAILHDILEETQTLPAELTEIFGIKVCRLVLEVTDDKTLLKAERKRLQVAHAPHKSDSAKQLRIADKIANIRDLVADPPTDWNDRRKLEYIDWAENVFAGLRGVNPGLDRVFAECISTARAFFAGSETV